MAENLLTERGIGKTHVGENGAFKRRGVATVAFAVAAAAWLAAFAPRSSAQCSVRETDANTDGIIDEVVIENEWYSIKFLPQKGGASDSWIYSPLNKQLACNRLAFVDMVGEIMVKGQRYTCSHPYACQVIEKGPDIAQIRLAANLPETRSAPDYAKVEISRTYTLRKGSPRLEVAIEVVNKSASELPFTLMVQHWVWVDGESSYYYAPDAMGVLSDFDMVTGHESHPVGSQDPAAGWSGYISKTSKLGLAFAMDWKYLDAIENWLSGGPSAAVQWPYLQQNIAAGGTWKTSYTVYSLHNMESLDGVTESAAVGVLVGPKAELAKRVDADGAKTGQAVPVKVCVSSPEAGEVEVALTARVLPETGAGKEVGKKSVTLKQGEAGQVEFEYTPAAEGLHVLAVEVSRGGKLLVSAERPFPVGNADQVYFARKPDTKKIGKPNIGAQIIDPPLPDYCFRFDRSWQTPHVPWGKPYFGGQTKVFFVSRDNYAISHWREIWERGDIEFDHAVLAKSASGKPLPFRQNLINDLMLRLNKRGQDVLFFAGLEWREGFTEPLRQQIFAMIRGGLGAVVLADPDAKPEDPVFGELAAFLAKGREIDSSLVTDAMPFPGPKVRLFEIEKGRVAVISGRPGYYDSVSEGGSLGASASAGFDTHFPFWEYGYSRYLRAIYWAAGRQSPVLARKAEATGAEARVTLENTSSKPVKAEVVVSIRNAWNEPGGEARAAAVLNPGTNIVTVPLAPALSGGTYVADVIARDEKGGSLAWGGAAFSVDNGLKAAIRMDRASSGYRPGEPVRAIVSLEKKQPEPVEGMLSLKAIDSFGREAWRLEQPVKLDQQKKDIEIALDGLKPVTVLHDLKLELLRGKDALARARHTFYIFHDRQPVYDDFKIGIYGGITPSVLRIQQTVPGMKELGIDEFYVNGDGSASREIGYRNNFFMITRPNAATELRPRASIVKSEVNTDTLVVTPSLSDTNAFALAEEGMRKHVEAASRVSGIDIYLLGDEWSWGAEFDYHPDNLARFREWLKGQYSSLGDLNAEWQTKFKAWDDVMPVKGSEVKSSGNSSNLASWFDFRKYMTTVWTQYVKRPYDAARSVNPRAAVGHEGVYNPSIKVGSDPWSFIPYVRVTARYNSMLEEWYLARDPEVIHGQYGGYGGLDKITSGGRFFPWRSLFHGGHWVFYYMLWDQAQPYQMIFDFDGSPHGAYPVVAKEEWADIKSGIGKLFIETRFTDDGIALPYSLASLYCADLLGVKHFNDLRNHKTIVQEMGFQHTSLSGEQIAAGDLGRRGIKLLLLPSTICLSEAEIKGIGDFVEKGGVVVANYGAGVRDGHGATRKQNPLDGLFGIQRVASTNESNSLPLAFTADAPEALKGAKPVMMQGEPGLRADKGKAWAFFNDGTAAMIANVRGKGRTLYMNVDINEYGASKAAGVAGEVIVETRGAEEYVRTVQNVFAEIYRLAGIERRLTVSDAGVPTSSGETFYYADQSGQALYCGVMIDVPEKRPMEVRFARKAHIYDVRDGKYHGLTDSFTDEFLPGRVQVYAALPYQVKSLDVSVSAASFKPGDEVAARANVVAEGATPLMHVFRFEVLDPAGKLRPEYGANLRADNGKLDRKFPLALNDPAGKWKIRVTDIASGIKGEAEFKAGE